MAVHPDLPAEQAYIDRAYEALEAVRKSVESQRDRALIEQPHTDQAVLERDMTVYRTELRLRQLNIEDHSLVFGRMDTEQGERFYIGRLGVPDENFNPLVVDWRAPIAEAFYRATGGDPLGLRLRRHLVCEGRTLVQISDESFGPDGLGVTGAGPLIAALERERTGRMRDIVATVQREQDEVIRGGIEGILVVQGGPGTGKTAVALHRAAYLLFTHRQRLQRLGVLVVGPNQVFLRYIEQVLPALGESGVALATIENLVEGVRVTAVDSPFAARLKGDVRMARVIERAVRDRQRPVPKDVEVEFDGVPLRVTRRMSEDIIGNARRRSGSHNLRRRWVENQVMRRLYGVYRESLARDEAEAVSFREFSRKLRREPEMWRALDRMWPLLRPVDLLSELFAVRPLLELATRGVLSHHERDALARDFDAGLTSADMPLLDEALVWLGRTRFEVLPHPDEEPPAVREYGHIVVDEAQELTPMQLRMLARRSVNASMTLVGDTDQASGAWASRSWNDILRHLPTDRGVSHAQLTINYRTPGKIMSFAGRMLRDGHPPSSVRDGDPPVIVRGGDVRAVVEAYLAQGGMTAVIAAPSMLAQCREWLDGLPYDQIETSGRLEAPISLMDARTAKGLEFDSVVVVEPAQIVVEADHGDAALYVALTRATQRLTIVHAGDLPPELSSG